MLNGQDGRVPPHGLWGGDEAVERPGVAEQREVVTYEQGSAAFAKVPWLSGFKIPVAQTAFEIRQ